MATPTPLTSESSSCLPPPPSRRRWAAACVPCPPACPPACLPAPLPPPPLAPSGKLPPKQLPTVGACLLPSCQRRLGPCASPLPSGTRRQQASLPVHTHTPQRCPPSHCYAWVPGCLAAACTMPWRFSDHAVAPRLANGSLCAVSCCARCGCLLCCCSDAGAHPAGCPGLHLSGLSSGLAPERSVDRGRWVEHAVLNRRACGSLQHSALDTAQP